MKKVETKEQVFKRLSLKGLDNQFQQEIERGLNCSPFESKLVTQTVHEVYFSILSEPDNIKPGQMRICAISEDEPAGKPISQCLFKTITISFEASDDLKIRKEFGYDGLRRHKILRVTQEALSQGTLLTVEDLAYRIFNVGYTTILRDIRKIREDNMFVPLRSTQKDIGRSISHKEQIVKFWLEGNQYGEISLRTKHSVEAISRYINLFKRAVVLKEEGYTLSAAAFLLKSSSKLIEKYWDLFEKYRTHGLPFRLEEIRELVKKNLNLQKEEMNLWVE